MTVRFGSERMTDWSTSSSTTTITRREARHHSEMGVLLYFQRRRTLPLDGTPEGMQGADAGVARPREGELPRAPGADHLVVDQIGREAGQSEVAAALPDDLVPRGKADQVGEPLDDDRVAVVDEARDGVAHGHELGDIRHQTSDIRRERGRLTSDV